MQRTDRLILFPYRSGSSGGSELIPEGELKRKYPKTWNYFNENKETLEGREDGKMRHSGWHGYVYPKALDVMALPKIFTPDLSPRAAFSLDSSGENFFTGGVAGGYGILVRPEYSPEFVLGLLNSSVLDWFHHHGATQMRGGWYSYESRFIRNLPIAAANPIQQSAVATVASALLLLLASDESGGRRASAVSFYDQLLNGLVYELFFQKELHAAGVYPFRLVEQFHLPDAADAEALIAWAKNGDATSHPIRGALFTLGSLETIRIIEGRE